MLKKALFIILLLISFHGIYSQNFQFHVDISWQKTRIERIDNERKQSYLYFDDANVVLYSNKLMPQYEFSAPIENKNNAYQVKIENTKWEIISQKELDLLNIESFSDTLIINNQNIETRKIPYIYIHFFPFRKNGNQVEKLISFDLQASPISISSGSSGRTRKSRNYVAHSILSNGNFYKMGIEKTGIYKLTPNDFQKMGINNSVSIQDIAIFGNGGEELPQSTSKPVFDDLQELAIKVVDENHNGIFDNNDYVLFYAIGVSTWNYNYINPQCQFSHHKNVYTNQTYYFLSVDKTVGNKKRINVQNSLNSSPTHEINTYFYYDVYENDNINIHNVGNRWFSEDFRNVITRDYNFTIKGIDLSQKIFINMEVASSSTSSSSMTTTINGSKSFNTNFYIGNSVINSTYKDYLPTSENISLKITYNKSNAAAIGYLDFIEIHAICSLKQHSPIVMFRNPNVIGNGNIVKYNFDTQNKNTTIWEVTNRHDISEINGTQNGNIISFILSADTLREFVAFDGSDFESVVPIGKVNNQDLHGLSSVDFIIITHPLFLNTANRLANFRRTNDNMKVAVVTTEEIYNEFSSGATDISAIRNFLKMFYDREYSNNNLPKNALLIGKTSYDVRQIKGEAACFIPNYQGLLIFDEEDNISTDNYFGKLADGKGNNNFGTMDIGIGRWPVTTTAQAETLLQKSINYASTEKLGSNNQVSNLGNWRNIVAFVADDDEDYAHMDNPENICNSILNSLPMYNVEKIYSDMYQKESSSQGKRYPEVNKSINNRVNNGCLTLSYFGHGGNSGWSHERILKISDIEAWNNTFALPVFYTACCSFAYYDQTFVSPGEKTLLSANGGGIGLISSTRNSSSGNNERLGKYLHLHMLTKTNNKYLTIGEAYMNAQNNFGVYESYIYLGDPSVSLAHPKINVVTDSINGVEFSSFSDTIKSLNFVRISGHIADENGLINNNFNGIIYTTIFDKKQTIGTINNNNKDSIRHFDLQKSILYKGKTEVKNGKFNFSFMVPKDINYEYGLGKISYYAYSNQTDASGYDTFLIGGISDTIINDNNGPEISLYLNDKTFVSGGITTSTPTIFAEISDSNGLNTAGAGIGHDMIAIIDNDIANAIVVNDYFEYDENSFTTGKLSYLLNELSEGHHTLKLRVWDIVNNMSESEIDFEVVNESKLKIDHVLNYPNPFTTNTAFYFEHNKPNQILDIKINIFTISGKMVKTILDQQTTDGFRSKPIPWNGLDDFGNKIGKGIYLYKITVRDQNHNTAEKIEKIVLL